MPRNDITSDRPIVLTARATAICQTRLSSPLRASFSTEIASSAPSDHRGSLCFPSTPWRATLLAMPMRLERSYRFEAAHYLPRVPPGHKCARMHGHSYQIEIAIEGEIDQERGWVIDFADIDEQAAPLVRQLDHQVLNEIEGLANPTSELLARWWWQRLAPRLPGLCEVVVSETPTSRCIYRGT